MIGELSTRGLSLPLLAALVAAAFAAVFFLYRRETRLLPRGLRAAVLALRLGLVASAAILLADPAIVRREKVFDPGEVVVAIDTSGSFAIADAPPDPMAGSQGSPGVTRFEAAKRALSAGRLGRALFERRVSVYAFDSEMRKIGERKPQEDISPLLDSLPSPQGLQTRLDLVLRVDAFRGREETISGLVVLTDGNHRGPGDPKEAARAWASTGIPLVLLGVGRLEPPRDLRIEAVEAAASVFAGDEVEAEARVGWSSMPALETRLAVSDGDRRIVEVPLTLEGGSGRKSVPLRFRAEEAGLRKFVVSIPVAEGEAIDANNRRDLWLQVREGPIRILYVDGGPRWQQIYLRAFWSRDERLDLRAFLLTPPPRRLPPDFPSTREELFAFDVLVLGDIEPAVFSREEIASVCDFVKSHGGTLIALAGERAMPYAWAGTALEDALPVSLLDRAPARGAAAVAARDGLPLSLGPAGERSEVTRLVPGREENVELWELLPPADWLCPIAGLKAGAEALVSVRPEAAYRLPGIELPRPPREGESDAGARRLIDERAVALASRPYGAGRVVFVGIDSTWRWRKHFGDEFFGRFWGRLARWAASGSLPARDPYARLGTDAPVYRPSTPVQIEAFIEAPSGKSSEGMRVEAVATRRSDGRSVRVRLEPVAGSLGMYRGELLLEPLGMEPPRGEGECVEYSVRLDLPDLPDYASLEGRAEVSFAVEREALLEESDLSVDESLLRELAELAGGTYLPVSRADEAAGLLRDASSVRELSTEHRAWHRPWLLAPILLGFPILEWILRKRRDLV